MLSTTQIDQFATFGFVVLRGHLAEHTMPLHHEVDAAIRDAYASTYHERVPSTASAAITCPWHRGAPRRPHHSSATTRA